ncbi:AMP-binding protein [Novispirillum sp. DQ9]|uniref:AMP-binding protein n=1 Tax=Novispirillum sp. DQ9 TaxID=3398612 RepID=UPI003C7A08F1
MQATFPLFAPPEAGDLPALIDGDAAAGTMLTHAALWAEAARLAAVWPAPPRCVTVLAAGWSPGFVVAYMAALMAGQAVCLSDPARDGRDVAARLRAEVVVRDAAPGDVGPLPGLAFDVADAIGEPVHPDLAVLLPTSGSTGSPRLVRLSAQGLRTNTADIVAALGLSARERAVGHLMPWYSYGLSVLNSHLAAGGSVVVTRRGPLDAGFWDMVRATEATTLPGVPFHYQMLRRFDLAALDVPALATLTQAGGRLDPRLVGHFAQAMAARGGRFVVMYGQTEAGPRIAVHAGPEVAEAPGAVGRPLAHVALAIERADGAAAAPGEVGEVVVRGPAVMMGYAETRADLAAGDSLGGVLRTGDQGSLDAAGLLTLAGRKARFAKLFGLRLDLGAIEAAVEAPTVAVEKGERLILLTEGAAEDARRAVVALTGLTPAVVVARSVDALPRLPNGKIDLRGAEALA